MKECKEIVSKLNKKEDALIGDFITNRNPKMTFESFHLMSQKEYLTKLEIMIKKYKAVLKAE